TRQASPQYSYPSCATFNVLLALLNGVARLAQTRCQRCLPRHAARCRAELIAPICAGATLCDGVQSTVANEERSLFSRWG
ncbi:hypothetical protein EV363DRAFT_1349183, partial [Boletus edulis]